MADNKIKIVIDADDKASDDIKKINKSLDQTAESSKKANTSFKNTFTEMASAVQLAQQAYQAINEVIKQTVGITVDYAAEVRDLQRASGMSAEETSKIIQLFDDMNVESTVLTESLRKMSQEGISFSVDKMAKMSDQYLKLEAGAERNKFLLDNFGRSGLEMAKAMEIGGDAIRGMADEMDGALILTQDNIDAARQYEIAMDNLEDAVMGVKISIGNELVPVLTIAARVMSDTSDEMERARDIANQSNNPMANLAFEVNNITEQEERARIATISWTEETYKQYRGIVELTPVTDALSDSIDGVANSTISASDAMKVYSDQLLFAKASENMTADEAFLLAESMGLVDERTVYATGKLESYQTMLDNGQISVDQYRALVAGLADQLDRITNRNATVTIDYVYSSSGASGGGGTVEWRAAGGPVSPNRTYIVGEYGPEILQMGSNGGMVIPTNNITNNYNLGVTTMNSSAAVSNSFAIMQAMQ